MDRKFFLAATLAAATVGLLHYMSPSRTDVGVPQGAIPGQGYRVPTVKDLQRPLLREIDFIDKKITQGEELVDAATTDVNARFSNYGGVLAQLDFPKHRGADEIPLRTVHKKTFYEQEEGSFLVALEEKTPFFYERKETEDGSTVYQAKADDWLITKRFVLDQDTHQLHLNLGFKPTSGSPKPIRPRLFFSGPLVGGVEGDAITGIVLGASDSLETVSSTDELDMAWVAPGMFGTQSKYFSHTLVRDEGHFAQRGYYKRVAGRNLYSIIEGPELTSAGSYDMSFYVGPKLIGDLSAVDSRLESLLSFGWLSPLCRFLLYLLNLFYSFLGNFGLAIILLSLLIEVLSTPLNVMARARAQEFQRHEPAVEHIRKRYRGDTEATRREIANYYQQQNVSPASAMMGIMFPLLLFPIVIALYRVLGNYLSLYHAPFYGWITDLSIKDPYYILPLIMVGAMLWHTSISASGGGRGKAMSFFFIILMAAFFAGMPAGLTLFWAVRQMFSVGLEYGRSAFA